VFRRLENSQSDFAKDTLKRTAKFSPLSMAVVFEQIKRGKYMDL